MSLLEMTPKGALERIEKIPVRPAPDNVLDLVAMITAKKALEKQIPQKKIKAKFSNGVEYYKCPSCGVADGLIKNYCPNCGQALDWRMSVLIKGMDMPKCCADCPLNDEYDDCGALDTDYYTEGKYTGRLPNCPLVEVPTPHGRLIDAYVMKSVLNEMSVEYDAETVQRAIEAVNKVPTIIESEGAE